MSDLFTTRPPKIVLIGLSGSGKSTVARLVARALDWSWADTDEQICARNRVDVETIFRERGEAYFRLEECRVIAELGQGQRLVIATGGGAPLLAENRRQLWRHALVIWLKARPETLAERLARSGERRPLLDGPSMLSRIEGLASDREPFYALADYAIETDAQSPEEVATEVLRAYHGRGAKLISRPGRMEMTMDPAVRNARPDCAATVRTPSGEYPVLVGWENLAELGKHLHYCGLTGRISLVSDANVAALYAESALAALQKAGFKAELYKLDPGEQNKTLAATERVFDWLISRHAERGEAIVALGGGVVTDLVGFVAATYLRGVPLIHVPTSLLGAVDAAIGGKTAVDHPRGKNLIGAFYQPRLVLIDGSLLRSLPRRELISGWAEVIKHGLIMDAAFVDYLEANAEAVRALDPSALVPVLRRSVQLKAEVVSADERESGLRSTLNYGHTIGHALEVATSYAGPLHGEAVAVGMTGAGMIANRIGLLSDELLDRQNNLLSTYELPLSWPGADPDTVHTATALDKKVRDATIRWVLLTGIGSTTMRSGISTELVRDVIEQLVAVPGATDQRS